MATLKPELKQILDRYGINPRDTSQVWDCHGTLVLYHKAFEIIAAKESIKFDPPLVLEANGAGKSVALCVMAHMGDRSEWATGEASPANCKNAYPYAMAEKRAKDRVIAKLVGLAQYVYSEDEAEEFKSGERKAVESDAPSRRPTASAKPPAPSADDLKARAEDLVRRLKAAPDLMKLNQVMDDGRELLKEMPQKTYDYIGKLFEARRTAMETPS